MLENNKKVPFMMSYEWHFSLYLHLKVYRELWRKYKVPVKDRDLTIVERPSDGLFSMEVAVCLEDLSALEEICLEYEDEYEDEDDNT